MNLITNCCIGGDYYNEMKLEYNNPFIWVIIKPNDMIQLIGNFNKLNFNNIKLLSSEFSNEKRQCFKLNIDNLVDIHYPHYLKNEYYKEIQYGSTDTSVDVLYYKIEDYIIETYKRRLNRMLINKEIPQFLILGDREGYNWDLEQIYKLDKISGEKICLISQIKLPTPLKNVYYINYNSENHYQTRIKNDKQIRNNLGF